MAKNKLTKPTVSLARDGYKFTLSFSNVDNESDYIYIDRVVYEAQDLTKGPNNSPEIGHQKLGAKKNSSWSYTLDKDKYYPFVGSGESDLNQKVSKVYFEVWTEGWHKYTVTTGKGKNKKKVEKKVWLKSDHVKKEYKFKAAKAPTVSLNYNGDGTSFTFGVDINDDYGIDDNQKAVATRAWKWLTSKVKGGKEQVNVLPTLITNDKDGNYIYTIQNLYRKI